MPVYKIHHITQYDYDQPVVDCANQIKIYPYAKSNQFIRSHDILINTHPIVEINTDYWGNKVGYFTSIQPHTQLTIDSRLVVQIDRPMYGTEKLNPLLAEDYLLKDRIKNQAIIDEWLGMYRGPQDPFYLAQWFNSLIYEKFIYEKGITTIETTVDETLEYGKGVCQDFAHVLLHILRTAKIPSRYVSGYICPNKSGLRGEGATHAWVDAYIPDKGWVGLDPTNNVIVSENHIYLAVGRDFNDCSTVKGTFKGMANQKLSVYVSVGYEDGHTFEDRTQVKLQTERNIIPAIIAKQFYEQQQQ